MGASSILSSLIQDITSKALATASPHKISHSIRLRRRLNREFYEEAQIPAPVAVVWFPRQTANSWRYLGAANLALLNGAFIGASHSEIQVDGRIYFLVAKRLIRSRSAEHAEYRARNGASLPFVRFWFRMTPRELDCIRQQVRKQTQEFPPNTCMGSVAQVLARQGNFSIPYPICISPLLSAAYLSSSRVIGNPKLRRIEHVGTGLGRTFLSHDVVGEIWAITLIGVGVYSVLCQDRTVFLHCMLNLILYTIVALHTLPLVKRSE